MLTHVPLCLLNEAERGEIAACAPGIPWVQTGEVNIIHLVLAVEKEKGLRAAESSERRKIPQCFQQAIPR